MFRRCDLMLKKLHAISRTHIYARNCSGLIKETCGMRCSTSRLCAATRSECHSTNIEQRVVHLCCRKAPRQKAGALSLSLSLSVSLYIYIYIYIYICIGPPPGQYDDSHSHSREGFIPGIGSRHHLGNIIIAIAIAAQAVYLALVRAIWQQCVSVFDQHCCLG